MLPDAAGKAAGLLNTSGIFVAPVSVIGNPQASSFFIRTFFCQRAKLTASWKQAARCSSHALKQGVKLHLYVSKETDRLIGEAHHQHVLFRNLPRTRAMKITSGMLKAGTEKAIELNILPHRSHIEDLVVRHASFFGICRTTSHQRQNHAGNSASGMRCCSERAGTSRAAA